jgi:hypothetical protein
MFGNKSGLFRVTSWLAGGLSFVVAAGCASNTRPADVPNAAIYETGGQDRLVYVVPNSGILYVTDQNNNALLYSGPVLAGDHVVVDPAANRVAINDQAVVSSNVNREDHRIYLLPGVVPPPPAALSSASLSTPRPVGVPPASILAAEGRDRVEYSAIADGVAWVVDASHNTVVYRTRVARGDHIVVDPAKNNLVVNGTRAYNGDLAPGDYRIFYSPEPQPGVVAAPVVVVPGARVESPAVVGVTIPPVPSTAVVLSESGTLGTITAAQSGSVWVTDSVTGRVVFSGHMRQGDTLVIDPATGRITLNAKPAEVYAPVPGRYRVSFMSGS